MGWPSLRRSTSEDGIGLNFPFLNQGPWVWFDAFLNADLMRIAWIGVLALLQVTDGSVAYGRRPAHVKHDVISRNELVLDGLVHSSVNFANARVRFFRPRQSLDSGVRGCGRASILAPVPSHFIVA